MLDAKLNPQGSGQYMDIRSINDFKLKSGARIPADTLAIVSPYNLTTANVKFNQKTYNVNMTDLHKWFVEFETLDIQDLETSKYKNGWPVEILSNTFSKH